MLFRSATFIGPLSVLVGNDDPPEWNGIGGPNYYHDKHYVTHDPDDQKAVDDKWLELMLLAAEVVRSYDPARAAVMIKKAHTRYAVVRALGWIWWNT